MVLNFAVSSWLPATAEPPERIQHLGGGYPFHEAQPARSGALITEKKGKPRSNQGFFFVTKRLPICNICTYEVVLSIYTFHSCS